MIILLSLLVAICGLVVYALTNNPKIAALALYAWACGLLAFLLHGEEVIKFFNK